VNGDGYSDVIVGARSYDNGELLEGRGFVYHGTATGLNATAEWIDESNTNYAHFGYAVAMAGDVNGDGFSDVIVGADGYRNDQLAEGRAFVYFGNGGDGSDRLPRQAQTDESAPISLLGTSDSESAFRVKAIGRTAAGRGNVQMQLEVKRAGVPFNGTGVVTGPVLDTGWPAGSGSSVPLSQLASGLVRGTVYRWRVRTVSDSPFFPRSPWFSLAGNAATEADLRTGGTATAVEEISAPAAQLTAVFPNPFAAATRLAYTLPQGGRHRLDIYDVRGRRVLVLSDGIQPAGRYAVGWDGRDERGHELPSGVYFFRLEAGDYVEARKVVLVR
jgi:hypothetical protein